MQTAKYARKPFDVEAVQVTADNLEEIVKWCGGTLVENSENDLHIKVDVKNAMNDRQAMAFVGDWILLAGTSYKVYTDRAFKKNFAPVGDTKEAKIAVG